MSDEVQPSTGNSRLRWGRAQKFRLTGKGTDAERSLREGLAASQQGNGRVAFDAAREGWAKTFGVQSDDGQVIAELSGPPLKLESIMTALEHTGASRDQVKDALERLFQAKLVEPVTAP